jgi:hypothetical protein
LLVFFAVGCGTDDARVAKTTAGAGWQLLTALDWQLDSGREYSTCMRTTVDRDLSIAMFEPISPSGTHHMVLSTGAPSAPDGQFGCEIFEPRTLLFATGLGPTPLTLPENVVARVRPGQQLLLSMHLFNTTPAPLEGTSGVRALIVEQSSFELEAEAISVGTLKLALPAGRETVTRGGCTLTHESIVFALHPHMHELGTHMKVVARSRRTERVIHDEPFDVAEQPIYPIESLKLSPGDRLEIECTHRNTTGSLVTYGESTKAEMCAVGVYRYPASSDGAYFCSD